MPKLWRIRNLLTMPEPNLMSEPLGRDPLHEDPYRYEIPKEFKEKYLREPAEKIPERLNGLGDMIRKERKNADARYAALEERFRHEKQKTKVLMGIIGAAAFKGMEVGAAWLFAVLGKMK
jgi:hypothetical protein